MNYTLALTPAAAGILQAHLFSDRTREQMAVTLCGVNRLASELRLLVRDVILLPPDAFRQQSIAHLEVKPEVQALIHARAHKQRLIEVDWHTHPGSSQAVAFSAVDDHYEAAQAAYLAERMGGVPFGSVVVNGQSLDARIWLAERLPAGKDAERPTYAAPQAQPLQAVLTGDLARRPTTSASRVNRATGFVSPIFDRQVRAFGSPVQSRLAALRVGVVGLGGLGSAIVAHLARLGVAHWVFVDPDVVELSNLNRLVNASTIDAQKARPKVYVARSTARQVHPKAAVRALRTDVFDPRAQRALKACDLLIVATDNHASRMAANRLAAQYLIPLVHVGFHIGVDERPASRPGQRGADERDVQERGVTDVSGEYAIPDLGRWCLQCAGIVDPQIAGWELAPANQRALLRSHGYVADTPAPAVGHLDGVVAALAAAEIHNLVAAFKPQHRYLVYDALRAELLPLKVTPSTACPVCSPDHGVLGLGDLEPLPDYRRAAQAVLPPPDVAGKTNPAAPTAEGQAVPRTPDAAPAAPRSRVEDESEPVTPAQPPAAVRDADRPRVTDERAARRTRLLAAMAQSEVDWLE